MHDLPLLCSAQTVYYSLCALASSHERHCFDCLKYWEDPSHAIRSWFANVCFDVFGSTLTQSARIAWIPSILMIVGCKNWLHHFQNECARVRECEKDSQTVRQSGREWTGAEASSVKGFHSFRHTISHPFQHRHISDLMHKLHNILHFKRIFTIIVYVCTDTMVEDGRRRVKCDKRVHRIEWN